MVKSAYISPMDELLTLTDHFRYFLETRTSICPNRLAKELKVDPANLHKILKGFRCIPQFRRGDFVRLMEQYGHHGHDELFGGHAG